MTGAVTPEFVFRTESDDPPPAELVEVDDRLRAEDALRRARRGETLWYRGTFLNARQLLTAMGKRLVTHGPPARSPAEAFRRERAAREAEHRVLSKLVVSLDDAYRLELEKPPEVRSACEHVWGPPPPRTVTPLKTLMGMIGAEAWRQKGLRVPGLKGLLTPFFGVYLPTRAEYVELLTRVKGVRDASVIEVGAGTGVLSFVLLQRGAANVRATDVEPRAIACATVNAEQLGLAKRFAIEERPFFPDGTADLVVCNPPWIPEAPKNRFDRAVFDEDHRFLAGFLADAPRHLKPGGRVLLIISDLAELLGLRPRGWLEAQLATAGLVVREQHRTRPKHGKAKDARDPLHAARAAETVSLYELSAAEARR